MEKPKREVWKDVEIHLEIAQAFDPKLLEEAHPWLALVMTELLFGNLQWRDSAGLLQFAGQKSLEAQLPQLRFSPLETKYLGKVLDKLFTAIEFDIVGHKVMAVPPPTASVHLPQGWRAQSGIWLCHQPLG
jgi:hypothetical protein